AWRAVLCAATAGAAQGHWAAPWPLGPPDAVAPGGQGGGLGGRGHGGPPPRQGGWEGVRPAASLGRRGPAPAPAPPRPAVLDNPAAAPKALGHRPWCGCPGGPRLDNPILKGV